MEAFIAMIISILISIPITVWQGFVLTKLWAWFIVPVFALPALGLIPAIGLALVISLLTTHIPATNEDVRLERLLVHQLVMGFVLPAFALLSGWCWHFFM